MVVWALVMLFLVVWSVMMGLLVRHLFPLSPTEFADDPITDEERRTYLRWVQWSALPMLSFTALFGVP